MLEAKIGNWIHFMRIAVKVLFAAERRVCDHLFDGFDSLRDQCFAGCTKCLAQTAQETPALIFCVFIL